MDYAKESLKMHYELRGKLEVTSRAAVDTKDALSLAYTPGVAAPCLEIQKDVNKSYELTRRWNTVAVVTDGTAVLGLGDIGPEAGMPVMEGKCCLFKAFGDVDAFPLCVRTKDVDEIVKTVSLLAGSFGGVCTLCTALSMRGCSNPRRSWSSSRMSISRISVAWNSGSANCVGLDTAAGAVIGELPASCLEASCLLRGIRARLCASPSRAANCRLKALTDLPLESS